ncbi:MAG: DUF6443 domain-containing protein [Pseudobacter sp.]|uniref:DUF6443 domain-containing protein n=1 Tax=Pseudobacter sp. TaxID=2045420 RepID=UPI003F7F6265
MLTNIIRSSEVMVPERDATGLQKRPARDVRRTISYFDGLGRPLQTLEIQEGQALVTPFLHDQYGRMARKYMPFLVTGNEGRLVQDPFPKQADFCRQQYPDDAWFFHQTKFEASPGSQVTGELPPGNHWVGTGHGIVFNRTVNSVSDSVRIWTVKNVPDGFGNYLSTGWYAAGTLYKTIVSDEDGRRVIEFTDKRGKLVLKKVQLSDRCGAGYAGWICTYFMYDHVNRLRCVLQPEGVLAVMKQQWILNNPVILAEQCFRYEYDPRGHLIRKQIPGGGESRMVYDAGGRMVLQQDANMKGQWLYYAYDQRNRLIASGLLINTQSREVHAALAAATDQYPDLRGQAFEELQKFHYDDYDMLPSGFITAMSGEDEIFLNTKSANEHAEPRSQSLLIYKLLAWSSAKVIGTNIWITKVNYYDDKGRLLQEQTRNISGSISTRSFQYNFTGQVLRAVERIRLLQQSFLLYTVNSYDASRRLVRIDKGYNSPDSLRLIAKYEYDETGRIKTKLLGTAFSGSGPLETLRWQYHIRGWVSGMNKDYSTGGHSENNWFGYSLEYGKFKNGNISDWRWKSTGDDQLRNYELDYDAANRLLAAAGGNGNNTPAMDFSSGGLQYDQNGNMLSLSQRAWTVAGNKTIDSLSYIYQPGTNRVQSIRDANKDTSCKLGDLHPLSSLHSQYSYDASGNMIADLNKGIGRISYNHLKLPEKVELPGKGNIQYSWSANGEKLKKIVTDSIRRLVHTTVYPGSAVFTSTRYFEPSQKDQEDKLQYILHEEGRTRFIADKAQLDFFVKDHLSNLRMILTEQQQTDRYPPASMELSQAAIEQNLYQKIPETRVLKPAGYPSENNTVANQYVCRLRGGENQQGPGMIIKVMAGDKFHLQVKSWYRVTGQLPYSPGNNLSAIISMLVTALPPVADGKLASAAFLTNSITPALGAFVMQRNNSTPLTKPGAFLNFLLLDEYFQPVITNDGNNTGFATVGADNELYTILVSNRNITKNGYLFVFLSNETAGTDVYFDDLQLTHIRGPLLEENHYYPFGMRIQALSTKAAGAPVNNILHAGREAQQELIDKGDEPAWYDFGARMYDVQTGRWLSVDAGAENWYGLSPYAYTGNNPVNAKEVDGNLFIFASGFMLNHWMKGSSPVMQVQQREWVDRGAYASQSLTVTNPDQYAPDRDYFRALPRNNGQPFSYWEEVDNAYRTVFNDNNAWYINGSFTPGSEAPDRFAEGLTAGRLLIERLDAGSISLGAEERIRIVGHSQGAAYAAGIATELAKHSKYGSLIDFVDYLSPHQPGDFAHPANIPGRQFSTVNDQVSSGYGNMGSLLNTFNGGSSLQKIEGVEDGRIRYYRGGGRGGHYVGTWVEDLLRYWQSMGIPVHYQ